MERVEEELLDVEHRIQRRSLTRVILEGQNLIAGEGFGLLPGIPWKRAFAPRQRSTPKAYELGSSARMLNGVHLFLDEPC